MLAACYELDAQQAGGELTLRELPLPVPGPGEVRVRVAVSGVNPTDWKARKAGSQTAAGAPLIVPNQDGAGTIDAAGDGVEKTRVGQRVWLYNAQWSRAHGTAAQWIALPAEQAVPMPDSASFDLGASLGIPAITAHRCLFQDGVPEPRARVLVHGGAGAVGHAAIELARWSGMSVAATVSSPEKARLASAAGAELVVDYRTADVVEAVRRWAPDGVERIIEVDLAANAGTDTAILGAGATISCYTAGSGVELSRALMMLNAKLEFVFVYTIPDEAKRAAVAAISQALRDQSLTLLPVHRFPLDRIAAAHDAVESGAVGKVLIDIP